VLEADSGVHAVTELHDLLRVYDAEKVEKMQEAGFVTPIVLNPIDALKRVFPNDEFDLSSAAFDANLARQMPEQFAQLRS